ncbi:DNA-binding response regulator [Chelativorans xinjiangense]|uniref:DNA-binding response regulator n=1 Tax=Chelativorans xinjiangense TaxID=2681485 RepID=UPI00135B6B3E|nr:DNA-binding response regulator [Chelativorans xinjiangense]
MPVEANILIVASDPTFRQSLRFVLEAEGCDVHTVERLSPPGASLAGYDCVVIDYSNARKNGVPVELAALGRPVILLVDRRQGMAEEDGIVLVEKPLLGRTLIDTVRGALGRNDLRGSASR